MPSANVSVKIVTLQKTVTSGQKTYPLYIGFLPAEDIAKIADAPAFTPSTPNREIAESILTPPVTQWQRPLDTARTSRIEQLFNGTGEFMPNPVLLSESVPSHGTVTVSERTIAGVPSGVHEVNVIVPAQGETKPLWILDGQHRINGLGKSAQRRDPVPFVLLLNRSGAHYSGPDLAKIFAQVTTTAEKLDDLHNEWLTFAFGLKAYGSPNANEQRHRDAMTAVAHLCRWPVIPESGGKTNPFFDHVQFNHHKTRTAAAPGGFSYSCVELKDLLFQSYYKQPPTSGQHLPPAALARQFLLAHDALRQVVGAPQETSAFFGDAHHGQRIMQDAFVSGILAYLLVHGHPDSWTDVLTGLRFPQTDWTFSSWTVSLSGANVTTSKAVAMRVLVEAFRQQALQPGTNNVGDYLQGDKAQLVFQAYSLKSNGKPDLSTVKEFSVDPGSVKTENIGSRTHVKLKTTSSNVAKCHISDRQSPPGRLVEYHSHLKKGMALTPAHTKPLQLLVTFYYYGGMKREGNLTIGWGNPAIA